jgi:hypothetical protein
VGNDALRLRQAAVEAALRAGDRAGAATDLGRAAELILRAPGLMATEVAVEEAWDLIRRGWELAGDDLGAQARLLSAEAFGGDETDPATTRLVERSISLARQAGDPLTESAALDELTSLQLSRGDVRAAADTALRRPGVLASVPVTSVSAMEFFDSAIMASECAVAVGDLAAGRTQAERLRDLPFYREEGHLATARLILVTVLAGDWAEASGFAARFRAGWERAGRPRAGNLSRGAYAAATLHGLRGDDEAREAWLGIVAALATPGRPISSIHFSEFFDAWLLLHRGHFDQAVRLLHAPPEQLDRWYSGMWRPWYAAVWAEAAVLAGHPDAAARLTGAARAAADNPIAAAVVARAAALATPGGDRDALLVAAAALRAAGCRYQWARTLVILGGEHREQGEQVLAAMGATVMAWPPEPC